MKKLIVLFTVCFSGLAVAQQLQTFNNGELADADDINENFEYIDRHLSDLESPAEFQDNALTSWGGAVGFDTITVDCNTNPSALSDSWELIGKSRSRVAVNISGTCLIDDPYLYIFSQHVILDGGSNGPYQCTSRATLKLPETAGSGLFLDASNNASLFLLCLDFEALDRVSIQGYGNAYIRSFVGVDATNNNLDIFLRSSIFRTDTSTAIDLTRLQMVAGSTGDLRNATIDDLQLFDGSNIRFSGGNTVVIENLVAHHRSTVTITTSEEAVTLTNCELTTESIVFLYFDVFRNTTDCTPP